jgi:DNA repair protein RadA/Sms
MRDVGLVEVQNPSEYLLNGRPENASGSVVTCAMEGTRPILLEIQALACKTTFAMPKRTAAGVDYNRVNLLMAVLEKKLNIPMSVYDAYVNVAGGMKVTEPSIDLGLALAIVSSMKDKEIPSDTMVFGEVGLSGEIRAVNMAQQRVQEAKRLGFKKVIMPKVCLVNISDVDGIELIGAASLKEAVQNIL